MSIDTLRRFFLPCFSPTTTTTKNRLSTSLRTTTTKNKQKHHRRRSSDDQDTSSTSSAGTAAAPPRPSKSMAIGTIFGNRRGHVWFCVQHDRLSLKPTLLLELSMFTHQLVHQMRCGLVRIALECDRTELRSLPLRSVPVWTMFCNGRKLGFAAKRRSGDRVRSILRTMSCVTVGAGVIPSGFGSSDPGSEELMYMRGNFEHVVGDGDSESFHLINPDECPGQELSVFLLRSTRGVDR